MDKDCGKFRDQVEDLQGRIPDEASGDALRGHAASCASCSAWYADRAALRDSLEPLVRGRRTTVPSEDLTARIVARIQQEAVASSNPRTVPFFLRPSTRRYAPVAAALAVFLAFGVFASLVAGGLVTSLTAGHSITPASKDSSFAPQTMTGSPSGTAVDSQDALTGGEGLTAASRLVLTEVAQLPSVTLKASTGSYTAYSTLVSSGAMGSPAAFRGYRNGDGTLTLLLLYASNAIQNRADAISATLAPCASPFRIEIIDGRDIGSTFTALGIADADAFLSGNTGDGFRLLKVDLGR